MQAYLARQNVFFKSLKIDFLLELNIVHSFCNIQASRVVALMDNLRMIL